MNNIMTFLANVVTLLEIYEQCHDIGHECRDVGHERRDVGHERRDVAGFSSDKKVAKIQCLGLLHISKLFFLHINHLRSSHDYIQ